MTIELLFFYLPNLMQKDYLIKWVTNARFKKNNKPNSVKMHFRWDIIFTAQVPKYSACYHIVLLFHPLKSSKITFQFFPYPNHFDSSIILWNNSQFFSGLFPICNSNECNCHWWITLAVMPLVAIHWYVCKWPRSKSVSQLYLLSLRSQVHK